MSKEFDPTKPVVPHRESGPWFGRKSEDGPAILRKLAPRKVPDSQSEALPVCNPEEES